MTIPDGPTIEYRLRYGCGCVETWLLFRAPDDEPLDKVADGDADCDPTQCRACRDYRETPRGCHCPNGRQNVVGRPLVEQRRITLLEESDGA